MSLSRVRRMRKCAIVEMSGQANWLMLLGTDATADDALGAAGGIVPDSASAPMLPSSATSVALLDGL